MYTHVVGGFNHCTLLLERRKCLAASEETFQSCYFRTDLFSCSCCVSSSSWVSGGDAQMHSQVSRLGKKLCPGVEIPRCFGTPSRTHLACTQIRKFDFLRFAGLFSGVGADADVERYVLGSIPEEAVALLAWPHYFFTDSGKSVQFESRQNYACLATGLEASAWQISPAGIIAWRL